MRDRSPGHCWIGAGVKIELSGDVVGLLVRFGGMRDLKKQSFAQADFAVHRCNRVQWHPASSRRSAGSSLAAASDASFAVSSTTIASVSTWFALDRLFLSRSNRLPCWTVITQ